MATNDECALTRPPGEKWPPSHLRRRATVIHPVPEKGSDGLQGVSVPPKTLQQEHDGQRCLDVARA